MAKPKNLRANEQDSFSGKNRKDFVVRKYGFSSRQFSRLCVGALVVVGSVAVIVYNNMLYGAISLTVIGAVLVVFAYQASRYQAIVTSTEFLNALFSSALSAGSLFWMLVKQDDTQIVYLDRTFQQMFPEMIPMPRRTLDTLLGTYGVADSERKAVLDAVAQGVSRQVDLKIQGGSERKTYSVTLAIEPIERPAGFCIVRGREKG